MFKCNSAPLSHISIAQNIFFCIFSILIKLNNNLLFFKINLVVYSEFIFITIVAFITILFCHLPKSIPILFLILLISATFFISRTSKLSGVSLPRLCTIISGKILLIKPSSLGNCLILFLFLLNSISAY